MGPITRHQRPGLLVVVGWARSGTLSSYESATPPPAIKSSRRDLVQRVSGRAFSSAGPGGDDLPLILIIGLDLFQTIVFVEVLFRC